MAIMYGFQRVALAFICTTFFTPAAAAEQLSLNQAIELALRSNPTVAAGQFYADAAKQAARGASALTNPEISISPNIIGDAGADSAILFVQPLEVNGSRTVRAAIASYQSTAAGLDAVATKRDVLLRVKQSYWDIARAQEVVGLNHANLQDLEILGTAVQKQYDVGAVPGSQVMKTDVEIARARQELAQAQLELSQAKSCLNSLLNRPTGLDFTVSDPLEFTDVALDRQALQTTGLAQRPEIASAQAQVAAAQRQIKAAQLQRTPDLAIQARRGTFGSGSDQGVALVVTLPILDWGSVKSDKRRTESAARSQEKQLQAVRNSVSLDVEQAFQLVTASSQIVREYQGGIIGKSEQLAQMARTGYEKGATSYLEVLEAQRTLRSTKTAYYSALADHARALAQLEWAAGYSLPDNMHLEVRK